jgi:hypothetical protein
VLRIARSRRSTQVRSPGSCRIEAPPRPGARQPRGCGRTGHTPRVYERTGHRRVVPAQSEDARGAPLRTPSRALCAPLRRTGLTDGCAGLDAVALSFTLTIGADRCRTAVAAATKHGVTAAMRNERDATAVSTRTIMFGGVGVTRPADSLPSPVIVREMPFLAAPFARSAGILVPPAPVTAPKPVQRRSEGNLSGAAWAHRCSDPGGSGSDEAFGQVD